MNVRFTWLGAAALFIHGVLHAQSTMPGRDPTLVEAASVLQGQDSLPFHSEARVAQVARSLEAIRRRYPELREITEPDMTLMDVSLADSLNAKLYTVLKPYLPFQGTSGLPTSGLPRIDSLNRALGVSRVLAADLGTRILFLQLTFDSWPNIPVLAKRYDTLPEVSFTSTPSYFDGSWIRLIPKPGRDLYVFSWGGGDCPSGCTERDYHYVTVDLATYHADREMVVLHGDTAAPSTPVEHWDTPTRFSVMPYPDADSLFRAMESADWWLRLHAAWAMYQMLGAATGPWHGAGEQDPAQFTALKQQVNTQRHRGLQTLVNHITDPDPQVAAAVLDALHEATQQTFGGGAEGKRRWRGWLESQEPPPVSEPSN